MTPPTNTKKPHLATRVAKWAGLGIVNFVDDAIFEALDAVPGYPRLTSYSRSISKKKQSSRR